MEDKILYEKLADGVCYERFGSLESEVNGQCPECGTPTVDGRAAYGCERSPIVCKICQSRPCDMSC